MPDSENGLEIRGPLPDASEAHGRAALVLVESLIHVLMERSLLSIGDTKEILATALEVQADAAEAADGASQPLWRSHSLLSAISTSLKHDGDRSDGDAR